MFKLILSSQHPPPPPFKTILFVWETKLRSLDRRCYGKPNQHTALLTEHSSMWFIEGGGRGVLCATEYKRLACQMCKFSHLSQKPAAGNLSHVYIASAWRCIWDEYFVFLCSHVRFTCTVCTFLAVLCKACSFLRDHVKKIPKQERSTLFISLTL